MFYALPQMAIKQFYLKLPQLINTVQVPLCLVSWAQQQAITTLQPQCLLPLTLGGLLAAAEGTSRMDHYLPKSSQ
jgi:hypothetical protein